MYAPFAVQSSMSAAVLPVASIPMGTPAGLGCACGCGRCGDRGLSGLLDASGMGGWIVAGGIGYLVYALMKRGKRRSHFRRSMRER